ncbi:MAG: hypothetical protein ACYTX0_50500 [Nostoc sp.]
MPIRITSDLGNTGGQQARTLHRQTFWDNSREIRENRQQCYARMMLNIEGTLKQDRLLRALTGLNRKAFDALLPSFSSIYKNSQKLLFNYFDRKIVCVVSPMPIYRLIC